MMFTRVSEKKPRIINMMLIEIRMIRGFAVSPRKRPYKRSAVLARESTKPKTFPAAKNIMIIPQLEKTEEQLAKKLFQLKAR